MYEKKNPNQLMLYHVFVVALRASSLADGACFACPYGARFVRLGMACFARIYNHHAAREQWGRKGW